MPSQNRRLAARRRAWGRGPAVLKFAFPPGPVMPSLVTTDGQAEPVRPSLVLRHPSDFDKTDEARELTTVGATAGPTVLGLVLTDGSRQTACSTSTRGTNEAPSGPPEVVKIGQGRRLSTLLRVEPAPLRVFAEGDNLGNLGLGLRQA